MNRIAGVITMHSRDPFSWFLIPGGVMGSSFVINLFIAALLGGKTPIYTGGLSSLYLTMLFIGFGTVKETFSFAVSFSVRRKDYLLGTAAQAVAVSVVWAILIWLLSLVESHLIQNWGVNLHFFHLPYVNDGSVIAQLWTYFTVMVLMFFLGLIPASIYQRFGRYGMYLFFGVIGLVLSVFSLLGTYWNWWETIFNWFAQQPAAVLGLWAAPFITVCVLSSFALLRKATV